MKISHLAVYCAGLAFELVNAADEDLKSVNLNLRGASHDDDDEHQKFRQDHLLLDDTMLSTQRITDSGTFKANGKVYNLNDLQAFNVFSLGATIMEDGKETPLEDDNRRTRLFIGNGDEGETILVTKDVTLDDENDDVVKAIDILSQDGTEIFLEALSNGELVTIRKEDRDKEKVKQFSLGGTGGDEDEIILSGASDDNGRMLQQSCSSYKVIEVAIAYDSSFCSRVAGGSSNQARSIVEQIVARTSLLYEKICIKVKVSHLEGFCSSSNDPYADAMATNNIGCGTFGALQSFQNYWNDNRRNVNRDSAHLFFGTDFPGGTIGCASLSSLCNGSAYGVNQISFASDTQYRSNLFSHELGHNAGAPHVGQISGNYLMEPSINSASNGFTSSTTSRIQSYVNSKSCIATETGNDDDNDDDDDDPVDDDDDFTNPNPNSFRLESSLHQGYCIAVDGSATRGTAVNLQTCDDVARTQNWLWDEQTHLISTTLGNNLCLIPAGRASNGASMVLWDCDPAYTYAEWSYYNDRTLRPDYATWKCLDVRNSDSTTLQIWSCNGAEDKKWIVRG